MSLQPRPLTGMFNAATQVATPVLIGVAPAAATAIHELDSTLPYLDQVTLFVSNNDAASQDVVVRVAGSPAMTVSIPAKTTRQIFDKQPFYGQQGSSAGSLITLQAQGGAGMLAFGSFTR